MALTSSPAAAQQPLRLVTDWEKGIRRPVNSLDIMMPPLATGEIDTEMQSVLDGLLETQNRRLLQLQCLGSSPPPFKRRKLADSTSPTSAAPPFDAVDKTLETDFVYLIRDDSL